MISLHYLLLISLIPISLTIKTRLKIFFLNGLNIIRCSDNQVQVYQAFDDYEKYLDTLIQCDNKHEFFNNQYAGFVWKSLKIVCTSSPGQVHEEQYIQRVIAGHEGADMLPNPKGQLDESQKPYELHVVSVNGSENITIKSDDQPANNEFFPEDLKRIIYMQFPGHPIICRIYFLGEESNPCFSRDDQDVVDIAHQCYYDPDASTGPTADELEAALTQVWGVRNILGRDAFVLNLSRPVISSTERPTSNENAKPNSSPKNHPGQIENEEDAAAANSPKRQKKSGAGKIIGIVLVILLLLALIGGVAFHFMRKNRPNESSVAKPPLSANIKAGKHKDSAAVDSNQSEESLADHSSDKIPTLAKEKPNVKLQTSPANKRQRPGANMAFNDDI